MRSIALFAAMIVAGCASQPSPPESHLNAAPNPTSAQVDQAQPAGGGGLAPTVLQAAKSPADVEAQRLAKAKNLNLKVVNKDGQELYCRSNYVTASHIQRDTTCYTADQVARMEERTTRELDQQNIKPNVQRNF
jgi:PBP1b-binding outer membrane lipoprotein LpoB